MTHGLGNAEKLSGDSINVLKAGNEAQVIAMAKSDAMNATMIDSPKNCATSILRNAPNDLRRPTSFNRRDARAVAKLM